MHQRRRPPPAWRQPCTVGSGLSELWKLGTMSKQHLLQQGTCKWLEGSCAASLVLQRPRAGASFPAAGCRGRVHMHVAASSRKIQTSSTLAKSEDAVRVPLI